MRVLVTGGTGYLGAAIVRALDGRGHHPIVFARRASLARLPGDAVDGDVRDAAAVLAAAASADTIVHAAALVSLWRRRRQDFDEINIGGLTNVLDAARTRRIRRIVYTSSFLALPPAGRSHPLDANDYQRTKRAGRDRAIDALAAGLPLVILYPGVVYGPGQTTEGNLVGRLLSDHLAGRLPGVIGSDRQWSFAFIEDVAAAHVSAIERENAAGEYTVGGVNERQMRVFEIVRELTGHALPRRIPAAAARAAGAFEEIRAIATGRMPLITRGAVRIFSHDWPMDSQRSIQELDYRITPLENAIPTTVGSLART